jgi:hypothetical protein
MKRKTTLIALAATAILLLAVTAHAGNKKLMTIKMAQQDLKRNFVEAIVGYKVKSSGEFGLTEDASYKVDTKAEAVIKGVRIDECIYDEGKDVALCYGHMDLGDIQNILSQYIRYKNVTLKHIGLGTMTESSRPALQALRAAMLNAYDELAALLVGEKIFSRSTAENFVLSKDSNKSALCAAVYGAYIPQSSVKFGKKGWGWDAQGDAWIILNLDVEKVKDLMGQHIIYKGQNIVEVMGQGSMKDELKGDNESQPSGPSGSKTKITTGNLGIPTSGEAPGSEDYKGGAAGKQ